jgi:hypothetical protein
MTVIQNFKTWIDELVFGDEFVMSNKKKVKQLHLKEGKWKLFSTSKYKGVRRMK